MRLIPSLNSLNQPYRCWRRCLSLCFSNIDSHITYFCKRLALRDNSIRVLTRVSPSLSFLLGAQIYQTAFANITSYRALPRAQFRLLQASIWPMYFRLQTILTLLVAMTSPHMNYEAFVRMEFVRTDFGLTSVLFIMATLNWCIFGPMTARIVMRRKHLGMLHRLPRPMGIKFLTCRPERKEKLTKLDQRCLQETKSLNNWFLIAHGASYFCNLLTILTSVWYALCLADGFGMAVA